MLQRFDLVAELNRLGVDKYYAWEDDDGQWGVDCDDPDAPLYYDPEMSQAQAQALADAHNAVALSFEEALAWLQARGIDWKNL